MQVRLQSGSSYSTPKVVSGVRSTVIYDDRGNPVLVAVQLPGEGLLIYDATSGDDFTGLLDKLGITAKAEPTLLSELDG